MSFPKWLDYVLFTLAFYLILALFGIPDLFMAHPQGIHFIRQTDTLSFVHHYLLNGMDFTKPGVLSLNSIDGNASCEFPLTYYLIALFSKLGIEPYLIMRFLSLSLTFASLLMVYRTCRLILKDLVTSMALTFLLFSSCVWVYYANGFSPDSSGVGLTLIGVCSYYQMKVSERKKPILGLISVLSFTMASFLKLTFAVYPIAVLMTWLWSRITDKSETEKAEVKYLLGLLIGLILAGVWFLVIVPQYNAKYLDHYFLTSITPIWEMDKDSIRIVWDHVSEWWFGSYYYPSFMHVLGVALVLFVVFYRWMNKNYRKLTLLSFGGCIAYFILFYRQFRDHDYYALVFVPFVFLLMFELTRQFYSTIGKKKLVQFVFQVGLLLITVLSLIHGVKKFSSRYGDPTDYYASIAFDMNGIDEYLDSLSIPRSAKILVVGDHSPNGGLYFAERMGWTVSDTTEASMSRAKGLINDGLQFIILPKPELLLPKDFSDPAPVEIGDYNGVKIYDCAN